jgi:hypothetical protein
MHSKRSIDWALTPDQSIICCAFTSVSESLFQLYTDLPSIAGCIESFDNHFIYIPRISRNEEFMKNYPANFIMTAHPGADANCKLVLGSGDFASCIIVKTLREIQETEELVLEKCGSISHLSERHQDAFVMNLWW